MLALPSTFILFFFFFSLFMFTLSYFCQSKDIVNRLHWKAFPQTIILRIWFLFPLFKYLFRRGTEESTWYHRAMLWSAESEVFRPSEHRSHPHSLKGLHSFCTMTLKQGWWDCLVTTLICSCTWLCCILCRVGKDSLCKWCRVTYWV